MGWFVVVVVLISIFFAGFSFKSLFLYVILVSTSFGLTYLFLTNKWGLDGLFEELFKIVELFGFGVPRRLENRIPYSSFYTNGGFRSLDEIPKPLEEGIKKLIDNVIRDFIRTWYEDVGEGERFISEARESLEMLCLEGYRRASQIDSHYLIEQVIVVFHGHLERFNKAKAVVKAKDPKLRLSISSSQLLCQTYESQLTSEPPSLSSPAAELNYLRNVIDSLLAAMIPKDTFSCDTGRFILREILSVKVMKPLAELLADPDWISQAVIDILSKDKDREVNQSQFVGDHLGMKESDDLGNAIGPHLSEEMHQLPPLVENTTTVTAQAKSRDEEMKNILRKESKESLEDVGERIEIMSPGACQENSDFHWSVSSQRQPPVGESQHDNTESYLVISVDESRDNSIDEQSPNGRNWSTEVIPPSSVDKLTSCSLSSSWGMCPSSQDESFNTESFENTCRKSSLSKVEGNVDVATKLEEFGHNLKELTCCHKFEESSETYQPLSMIAQKGSSDEWSDIEEPCPRFRTRSLSLPGHDEMFENKAALQTCDSELSRSVSVPSKLSFADFNEQHNEEFSTPTSPRRFYGSRLYNTSFGSSSDSFKSVSSEEDLLDSYIERGEEAVEHFGDFDSYRVGSQWAGTRHRITKQTSFEESMDEKLTSDSSTEDLTGSKDRPSPFTKDKFRAEKMALQSKKNSSELDDIRESSMEAADKDHPEEDALSRQKHLRLGFGAHNTESFGDAFLTAGKKFVSNFKPPFKFDSLSSSSAKSTEASTTSEGECQDYPSGNQQKITPMKKSLDVEGARAATYTSFGGRKLSRSDAMIQESMDGDGETCYGTPREEMDVSNTDESLGNSPGWVRSVQRMHPSQLISIPNTVIALETTWEPGRNKYTLYKIEYDIRIWHEVYSAAIKQAKNEAKKERAKKKLYGAVADDEPEDEEISLDVIKRNVPLKRMIHRRYREFMELHNRLTAGKLGVHMKDILKPNRKYNLPFGRLDPHVVEGRRKLLQYYLGSLISKPPLRNSEDLKQFLGVTGGEQVSFIKPSVAQIVSQSVHVPRVDKMLSRQMTKVIDTIKTAFDSVEEEENTSEEYFTAASENSVVHWKLACHQDVPDGESYFNPENAFTALYYSAFLADQEEFTLPTPPSPIHFSEEKQKNGDEKDGPQLWGKKWKNKVPPSDSEDEAVSHQVHQSLGPRTAGDGSDNPDEPVALSSDAQVAPVSQAGFQQRERSGAIFKKYLDNMQSSSQAAVAHKPLRLSVSQPAPKSKSMEGIDTGAPNSKFQFKPQKIFEAAKQIGQGSKPDSLETLDALSTVKEKKQGTFKKFLKDTSMPVFSGNSKKQKGVHVPVSSGTEKAPSPKQLPLHPEDPCAVSEMDQPSNLDDGSLVDKVSAASDLQCPLSDAILTLLCELLKERRSWLTVDRVQQAFTATLGGLFEWHIQSGIDDITSDDCWALYLDKLNEAIWPGGKLCEDSEKPKTEIEKARRRKEAVRALMNAFPGFIMLLIGPRVYHQTALNIIDSMQYSQLNKILLYTLLELLLSEFIPEILDTLQFFRRITTQK